MLGEAENLRQSYLWNTPLIDANVIDNYSRLLGNCAKL